ncbi:protein kinase domain-containing protein [Pleionea sediminis]|uniref:protein kinase domain-containing protein n=1 Tax=Pleionea sediminis TaxID=2569479 RepID=UPI001184922A|nr:serine/threonine-protein kinase [Pleionea sediminis]
MEISGYQLKEQIGEGGMSEVYLAEQLSLRRTVAIKFLSEQLLNHTTALDLFENEPLIVARLNHPKIIHVIDKGVTESGKPYFVMEYVKGVTLHDLVQDDEIPMSKKIQYIIQVCRGLAYAHRNSIVHSDIKPANIIVDTEDNARILDFGIASFYTDERFQSNNRTQVIGTERYMAPEVQISSANASLLSDIYSLGVMMFEVFTENFIDPVSQPNIEASNLPKSIKKVISQCIAKDPSQRPTSASVVENQLLQVIKGAHLAASQKESAEKDVQALNKKFTLLDVLNENEFSTVYLYEKKKSNDLIVIKKRNHDSSGLKEAKILSNLKHPNIINIYGTASNQRAFIVVMEYMNAGALSDRLLTPFKFNDFFSIATDLVDALVFAHQNRVHHGNIRPSNILFSQTNEVKLTDFGLSEHYHHEEDVDNWYSPQKEEAISPQLDIFALGAVFYHMLTGSPIQWKKGQIAYTENYGELPKRLHEFLLKMLALEPSFRFQTAVEVQRELAKLKALPEKDLKRKSVFTPIGIRRKAKASLPFFRWFNNLFWILVFSVGFTYLQIYFFLPEVKIHIHQILREFLLWWAAQLKP